MTFKRPGAGRYTSTPHAATMQSLLGGGAWSRNVDVTSDELAAIRRMYEAPATAANRPGEELLQAGEARYDLRMAQTDGLRMLAWLARYVEPGDDPVKVLVHLAVKAGWDVPPEDVAWSEEDAEEEPR